RGEAHRNNKLSPYLHKSEQQFVRSGLLIFQHAAKHFPYLILQSTHRQHAVKFPVRFPVCSLVFALPNLPPTRMLFSHFSGLFVLLRKYHQHQEWRNQEHSTILFVSPFPESSNPTCLSLLISIKH